MTTTSPDGHSHGSAEPNGGRRVVKVSGRAIAAARAQVAISEILGRPVSETVRKIAAVRKVGP
jgi:hypothetical protein